MPHQVTVLTLPEDAAHVGIMLPSGRLVEVKLTRWEPPAGSGRDPRLVIDVDEADVALVAIRTPSTANWGP